jgi:hypothetical protein
MKSIQVIKEFSQLAGSMWPDDESVIYVAKPAEGLRQYNPEDSSEHHTRRRENLKSHIYLVLYHHCFSALL